MIFIFLILYHKQQETTRKKEGKIDWSFEDVVLYYTTWYYVENAKIDWNYTGLVEKDNESLVYHKLVIIVLKLPLLLDIT